MAGDRIVAEMCTISMATEFFGVDPADGTLTQLSASRQDKPNAAKITAKCLTPC